MESPERQNPFLKSNSSETGSLEGSLELCNDEEQTHSLYALSLKEFAPLTRLLGTIPTQAQRGLSKFDIEFTCLDVHPNWIAIGSNVGTLFLYHRQSGELTRLRYQDYLGSITSVCLYAVGEMMLAFGTRNGTILVYQMPDNTEANKQLECFPVSGYHSSPITCLTWSQNGMLLFSGDASGKVVSTTIEYYEHCSRSRVLFQESHSVVQLSYHPLSLLVVSTTQKCFLCHLQGEEQIRFVQIGQKERKLHGNFGVTFDPISLSTNSAKICTARPGLRLWKASLEGIVTETLLLKDSCVLARQQASIEVLNMDYIKDISVPAEGEQFGILLVFQGLFLLTWNTVALYVLDPEMRGVVASTGLGGLSNIVDVATCTDEIFVLQGKRNIRRLATSPEQDINLNPIHRRESEASQLLSSILSPLQGLVKERSSSSVFEWFRTKPDANKNVTKENFATGNSSNQLLPPLVALSKDALEVGLELKEISEAVNQPHTGGPDELCSDNRPLIQNSIIEEKNEFFNHNGLEKSDEDETDSPVVVYKVKKGRKKRAKAKTVMREMVEIHKEQPPLEVSKQEPPSFTPAFSSSLPENQNEDDLLAKILGSYVSNNNINNNVSDHVEDSVSTNENASEQLLEDPTFPKAEISAATKETNVLPCAVSHSTIELDCAKPLQKSERSLSKSEEPLSLDVDIYTSLPVHKNLRREANVIKQPVQVPTEKLTSTEDAAEEPLGEEWVQYRGPSDRMVNLAVSSNCLYVVDANDVLYYSNLRGPGLEWFRMSQMAQQVSVSPSGSFLWVLYKHSTFAAALSPLSGAPRGPWREAAKEVSQIAVDENCAWYSKLDGELRLQRNLSASRPCFKSQKVSCPVGTVAQLSCRAGVLWALTQQSRLYCCGLPAASPAGIVQEVSWREIVIHEPMCLASISLGANCTGWFVNDQGNLWVKEGVSLDRPQGEASCWQVSMDISLVKEKEWRPFSSLSDAPPLFLAAGDKGLWFTVDSLLWASRGNLTGHKWDRMSRSLQWTCISTSESSQGSLWLLNQTGQLHCLPSLHSTPLAISLTSERGRDLGGRIVCMSPYPSLLWVLTDSGKVLVRVGVSSPSLPQGTGWVTVDLSQIGECKLADLSCGENVVWACDSSGCVWARIGPLTFNQSMEPAWIQPDDDRSAHFSKVYVSGNGQLVWAVDSSFRVYVREGVSQGYPIGRRWNIVPGMQALALAVSNRAVYALSPSGQVHRRSGVDPEQYPAGIRWKHLQGIEQCLSISVTARDELWALDKAGNLLQHVSTRLKHQTEGSVHQHPVLVHLDARDGPEEDWEVI